MSRIGKLPIPVPKTVQISYNNKEISLKGPKGELKINLHPELELKIDNDSIKIERFGNEKADKSIHGLYRALINNGIIGVTQGFEKKLEIQGVGYKAQIEGKKLILNLGYSHPIEYTIPEGITIKQDAEKKNILIISSPNRQLLGSTSAKIRSYKKPEPYKGKGIRYSDEIIIRKAGKTAGASKEK